MLCRDTSRGRNSGGVAWRVYVRTYCVPIATSNQNKRSQLLYLGDAQITSLYNLFFKTLLCEIDYAHACQKHNTLYRINGKQAFSTTVVLSP